MKKIIFFLLIIFISGCSYYSFKGSIPAHINSISIAPIVNESSEFGISEQVMSQLNNYFIKENILDLLEENEAESRLTIIIKSLEDNLNDLKNPFDKEGITEVDTRRIKEIENEIDEKSLPLFLRYGYIPSPYSIYKDILKLEPSTILSVDLNNFQLIV